jgi:hypothetical protein
VFFLSYLKFPYICHVLTLITYRFLVLLVEEGLRAQNAIWNFRVPCGHKHLHNNLIFLLLSFHSPAATNTFTIMFFVATFLSQPLNYCDSHNYINNKGNSIAIISLNVRLCDYRAQIPRCNDIIQSDDTYLWIFCTRISVCNVIYNHKLENFENC